MSTAAGLSDFTPALGHTYLPPAPPNRPKTSDAAGQASKEATPMPDSTSTVNSKKLLPPSSTTPTAGTSYLDSRLLAESLDMTFRYSDEYMDDNPITGHPGDFHLSATGRKNHDELLAAAKAAAALQTAKAGTTPTPETKATEGAAGAKKGGTRGDKSPRTPGMPKLKRRKSKAPSSAGGG